MKRQLDNMIRDNFVKSHLWNNKIKADCLSQNVFLAIRNNQIDLYHKGGRLFCFDNAGFKTHIKYASVITGNRNGYLTEGELSKYKLASDFETNYSRIKENCSNYSGIEALGVSELYQKHSYLSHSNIVVLDIEISFESLDENSNQDRIDILLYDTRNRVLHFAEAKHYSNQKIWSTTTPKVIEQIKRYESQIAHNKASILSEYGNYVHILNTLFNISLLPPIDVEKSATLLIFGFDNDQKTGRLKTLITDNPVYSGIKTYPIGNIAILNEFQCFLTAPC